MMGINEDEGEVQRLREWLEVIRDFNHISRCSSSAPVHECCCTEFDQSEMAEKALAGEEPPLDPYGPINDMGDPLWPLLNAPEK